MQERPEYLMMNGYSQADIDQLREHSVKVVKTLKWQGSAKTNPYNKTRKGKYNESYKHIKTEIQIEYLEKGGRGGQRLIARARCGNLEEQINTGWRWRKEDVHYVRQRREH